MYNFGNFIFGDYSKIENINFIQTKKISPNLYKFHSNSAYFYVNLYNIAIIYVPYNL